MFKLGREVRLKWHRRGIGYIVELMGNYVLVRLFGMQKQVVLHKDNLVVVEVLEEEEEEE